MPALELYTLNQSAVERLGPNATGDGIYNGWFSLAMSLATTNLPDDHNGTVELAWNFDLEYPPPPDAWDYWTAGGWGQIGPWSFEGYKPWFRNGSTGEWLQAPYGSNPGGGFLGEGGIGFWIWVEFFAEGSLGKAGEWFGDNSGAPTGTRTVAIPEGATSVRVFRLLQIPSDVSAIAPPTHNDPRDAARQVLVRIPYGVVEPPPPPPPAPGPLILAPRPSAVVRRPRRVRGAIAGPVVLSEPRATPPPDDDGGAT